jgi:hypothetical protein
LADRHISIHPKHLRVSYQLFLRTAGLYAPYPRGPKTRSRNDFTPRAAARWNPDFRTHKAVAGPAAAACGGDRARTRSLCDSPSGKKSVTQSSRGAETNLISAPLLLRVTLDLFPKVAQRLRARRQAVSPVVSPTLSGTQSSHSPGSLSDVHTTRSPMYCTICTERQRRPVQS